MLLEPCPGCGALFAPSDGATHPYIGASAGCWALFTTVGAGYPPDPALLAASRVAGSPPDARPPAAAAAPGDPRPLDPRPLLGDAYAVQHPGDGSPPAVQSVAVHLLTLHGVLRGGQPVARALWLRRRALRERGVYHRLRAPAPGEMFTLRHLFPGGGVAAPVSVAAYVETVYARWAAANPAELAAWYARHVLAD